MGCPESKDIYREDKNTADHKGSDEGVLPPDKGHDQSRNNKGNVNMPRDVADIHTSLTDTTDHHELQTHGENSDRSTAGYPDNNPDQHKCNDVKDNKSRDTHANDTNKNINPTNTTDPLEVQKPGENSDSSKTGNIDTIPVQPKCNEGEDNMSRDTTKIDTNINTSLTNTTDQHEVQTSGENSSSSEAGNTDVIPDLSKCNEEGRDNISRGTQTNATNINKNRSSSTDQHVVQKLGENSDRQKQNKTSKKDFKQLLKEEKEKNVKLETRIAKGSNMLKDSYDERDKLREQYQHEKNSNERQLLSLQCELTNVKDEKERLLIRLSAMAGAKMTDNNPNITDLSDANRPTKLAEKYSELYDNAWTDAFSQLTEKDMKSEKEAIQILLDTFLNIYKECMRLADTQLKTLTKAVTAFGTVDGDLSEIMKPLKDKRKKQYPIQVKQLEPLIVDQLLKTTSLATTDSSQIKPFLDKSLELCWLMVIQDPPVYVDSEINIKGQAFDKNMFKEYTSSGKTIDFIVWPALFIQERGALLCKGVAQGQKHKDIRADGAQTVRHVSCNASMPAKTSNKGLSKSVYGNSSSTATSLNQPPTQQVQSVPRKAEHTSSVTPLGPPDTYVIQKEDTLLSKGVSQGQNKKNVRADDAQTVKAVSSNAAKPAKTSNRALSKSADGSSSSTTAQLKQPITQQMDSDGANSASAPSVTPSKTPNTNVTSSEHQSTHQRNTVATKDAHRSDTSSTGSIKPSNSTAPPGQHKLSITVKHVTPTSEVTAL